MSKLGPFPMPTGRETQHPVLRYIDAFQPDLAEVEVVRPKDVLGFKTARIYLNLTKDGIPEPPAEYAWDDELNVALTQRGIKSSTPDAEMIRFGLDLRYRFRRLESRYGDGFFNSVLILQVKELGFDKFAEVRTLLKDIHTHSPHKEGNSYQDCREAISASFGNVLEDLYKKLGYPMETAEEILVGAVARYLDERFTVSDRIRIGWA